MARTHEEQRAALAKEREQRKAAYLAAIARRDEIAAFANAADATEFDRRELSRAEARVELVRTAMRHWNDPTQEEISAQTAAGSPARPSDPTIAPAASSVEATAARILASDIVAGEGRKDAEVDAIAARIAAA